MSGQSTAWRRGSCFASEKPKCFSRRGRRKKAFRRGAAAVEFAMVAPLFFGVLFGIVEFGRAFMVQQILTNASREGARAAILESATTAEVVSEVQDYLTSATIPSDTATVAVTVTKSDATTSTTLSEAGSGDPIEVLITVDYTDVSWIPSWFIPDTAVLSARTIMLAERLQ